MENPENEKIFSEEGSQLNRNRSFKSKQLVRSQAIRESTSPPRTLSPCVNEAVINNVTVKDNSPNGTEPRTITVSSDESSQTNSDYSEVQCCDEKKQRVEIQITSGKWEDNCVQSACARWTNKSADSSRDLLSNSPRVTCVCGACACPHCRGRRRQHQCPTKQDSGIVCDRDDASDNENTGSAPASDSIRKSSSMDDECRCTERKDRRANTFSRYDSDSDLSGPDLVRFIKETLNKNPRDRITLLKIEKELHELVHNNGRCVVRFPTMSSYGRLLVHRCATLFQLGHRLDPYNKTSVLVSKTGTSGGQIPCTQFKQWCTAAFSDVQHTPAPNNTNTTNAKSILKRASGSLEEMGGCAASLGRSRSLEQRQRDYQRVRSRIFSEENCASDESQWPWLSSGPVKLLTPESGRKLLKVQSLENSGGELARRGAVSKSHSFGGEPHTHRLLSKQGDLASSSWRLSPSSSGYKTLSLRSTDSITPSPTGGASPEPVSACGAAPALVWAVTDLARVPPGALVIHPQTGRPLSNPDGSLYHFDPANPPVIYDASSYEQTDDSQTDLNNDRRRGRLEKQHSFIDNDCECQSPPTEEFASKCCCEYRRTEQATNNSIVKQVTNAKPTSPNITYDKSNTPPNPPESTNPPQKQVQSPNETSQPTNNTVDSKYSTNHQSYDQAANQKEYELTNQSAEDRNKLTNQSSQMYAPQNNYNPYANEELQVQSPPQIVSGVYTQPDMPALHPVQKVAPVIHDPGMHQIPLTSVIYPAPAQTYPYINQYRSDQQMQPGVYQPVDAHKQMLPHGNENNTFRIDPSYPYPPVDYSQCGPCTYLEPAYNTTHRPSYNVNYGQMEVPNMMPANVYSAPPVVLPPTHHYPYQDAIQWSGVQPMFNMHREVSPKMLLHDVYPYCGLVCPPMIPATYNMCGMYPALPADKPPPAGNRTRVLASARDTPLPVDDRSRTEDRKSSPAVAASPELAVYQIKQQMAQLSTRRAPIHQQHRPEPPTVSVRPSHDDSQLSSAARAIVNSIRNIQTKNNFHGERQSSFQPRERRRYEEKRPFRPPPLYAAPQMPHAAHLPQIHAQIGPGNWCRRSPAPGYPVLNNPRRQHPNGRNERR